VITCVAEAFIVLDESSRTHGHTQREIINLWIPLDHTQRSLAGHVSQSQRTRPPVGLHVRIRTNMDEHRFQQIQNSLARAVVKAPKSSHITPILKSLHWLKVNERIEYKLLSLTYKVLTTSQPSYLNNLISVQPPRSTRSSSVVTRSRLPTISSLKITDRSFRYASPRLWN